MSQHYAFFFDDRPLEAPEARDRSPSPMERFTLSSDTELAGRPDHHPLEKLQDESRPGNERLFGHLAHDPSVKDRLAQRAKTLAASLENKLNSRKGDH